MFYPLIITSGPIRELVCCKHLGKLLKTFAVIPIRTIPASASGSCLLTIFNSDLHSYQILAGSSGSEPSEVPHFLEIPHHGSNV